MNNFKYRKISAFLLTLPLGAAAIASNQLNISAELQPASDVDFAQQTLVVSLNGQPGGTSITEPGLLCLATNSPAQEISIIAGSLYGDGTNFRAQRNDLTGVYLPYTLNIGSKLDIQDGSTTTFGTPDAVVSSSDTCITMGAAAYQTPVTLNFTDGPATTSGTYVDTITLTIV